MALVCIVRQIGDKRTQSLSSFTENLEIQGTTKVRRRTEKRDGKKKKKMVGMMGWGSQEQGWRKGPWTPEEDKLLSEYVGLHGEGRWSSVGRSAGKMSRSFTSRL